MKEHLLLTGRSQRIHSLTIVNLRVARAESIGIPVRNVKVYGMGCIYLGLLHFLNPVLVFTSSVSYKVSIWSLCAQLGNLSFTTHTARGPTGEVTLGKFHWGLFRHSWNCKGFETSTGHEIVRTLHRSSIWFSHGVYHLGKHLGNFWARSKGLSIYNTL